jgi:hypothetical protein
MALSKIESSIPREGLRLKNVYHLGFMWAPNLLNPNKLLVNLRHPIREVFHTSHRQEPVEMLEGVEYHLVEHLVGDRLVTVDIIKSDTFPKGITSRLKHLFDNNFYYGHANYFPLPFRLINRTYVNSDFSKKDYIERELSKLRGGY